MFTMIAFFGVAGICMIVERKQKNDLIRIPGTFDDDTVRESIVHARQDLRLVAYLLMGIIVMLGFIADRIH